MAETNALSRPQFWAEWWRNYFDRFLWTPIHCSETLSFEEIYSYWSQESWNVGSMPGIGEGKPSYLMDSMLALCPTWHTMSPLLLNIFLQRIPVTVRGHLHLLMRISWHTISATGAEPLISLVSAIQDFLPPSDVQQLQQFLGMINFTAIACQISLRLLNHSMKP